MKPEIKKDLKDFIANSERNESTDIQQMAEDCTANEKDAAKVIQEFEEIIRNKKSDIVWPAYYLGKIFQKFRSKEQIVNNMVLKFKVSKSTIVFKIALSRLIDNYSEIEDSSLSFHYFLKKLEIDKRSL